MTDFTLNRFFKQSGDYTPDGIDFEFLTLANNTAIIDKVSVPIIGSSFQNYSAATITPSIWRMGNFAYNSPPHRPIQGQLWYNTGTNTLNVFVGDDHSESPSAWYEIRDKIFDTVPTSMIPTLTNTYDLGNNDNKWNDLWCNTITAQYLFKIGGYTGTNLDSLVPTDTAHLYNTSDVPGNTVSEALTHLDGMGSLTEITDIIDNVDDTTTTITPTTSRIRLHTSEDILVTIDPVVSPIPYFQIIAVGYGTFSVSAGVGVTLRFNKAGTYATHALFIKDTNDQNTWDVYGNFI